MKQGTVVKHQRLIPLELPQHILHPLSTTSPPSPLFLYASPLLPLLYLDVRHVHSDIVRGPEQVIEVVDLGHAVAGQLQRSIQGELRVETNHLG